MDQKTLFFKDSLFLLPSQGVPYNGAVQFLNGDSVRIRPMIGADQKSFPSSGGDPHRLYFSILSKVILEPHLDPNLLLMSDANAILYAMRIMSFGPEYPLRYRCPECNAQSDIVVSLQDLNVKYAEDMETPPTNQHTYTSVDGKTTIDFHLPHLADERMVSNMLFSLRKKGKTVAQPRPGETDDEQSGAADRVFCQLAALVDQVNGEPVKSPHHTVEVLQHLPLSLIYELQDTVAAVDTGLEPFVPVTCRECQWQDDEVSVLIGPEFFRPPRRRTVRLS